MLRTVRSLRTKLAIAVFRMRAPALYLRKRRVQRAREAQTTFVASMPRINCRMLIDANTYFSEVYVRGYFEPGLVQFLDRTLRRGMTCIDVGANVGYLTLFMAKKVGNSGCVVAFEPASNTYSLLQKNVALNGFQQVITEHYAVSDHIGTLQFHEGPAGFDIYNSAGRVTHPAAESQTFATHVVPCLTLGGYFSNLQLSEVDLIKIDVEGAELDVLKGMAGFLESSRKTRLIIEFDDRTTSGNGYSALDLENWLRERGWHLAIIGHRGMLQRIPVNHEWRGQIVVACKMSGDSKESPATASG